MEQHVFMFLSNLLVISLHPKVSISLVSVFIYFVQVTEGEREFVIIFGETLKLSIEIKFFISLFWIYVNMFKADKMKLQLGLKGLQTCVEFYKWCLTTKT